MNPRNLSKFSTTTQDKYKYKYAIYGVFKILLFLVPQRLSSVQIFILRIFGAKIGTGVKIRSGVKVHFPWNLEIGNHSWIGEDVWFINHEKTIIGSNVCISQRSIISSGGHNYRSATLEYSHKPIEIKDGAWICLDVKILPGVTVGECSVISAGEIVRKSVPAYSILISGEIRPIDPPK